MRSSREKRVSRERGGAGRVRRSREKKGSRKSVEEQGKEREQGGGSRKSEE